MINWKVRMRNPMFWAQILLSVIMPILAYLGLTAEDLSSWSVLGEGFTDSKRALTYDTPNSDKE